MPGTRCDRDDLASRMGKAPPVKLWRRTELKRLAFQDTFRAALQPGKSIFGPPRVYRAKIMDKKNSAVIVDDPTRLLKPR